MADYTPAELAKLKRKDPLERLNVPVQKVIGSRAGVSTSPMRRPTSAMQQATTKQASRPHVRMASARAAVPDSKSQRLDAKSFKEDKEEEKREKKVYSRLRNPDRPLKAWDAPSSAITGGWRMSDNESSHSEREIKDVPKVKFSGMEFNQMRFVKNPRKIV